MMSAIIVAIGVAVGAGAAAGGGGVDPWTKVIDAWEDAIDAAVEDDTREEAATKELETAEAMLKAQRKEFAKAMLALYAIDESYEATAEDYEAKVQEVLAISNKSDRELLNQRFKIRAILTPEEYKAAVQELQKKMNKLEEKIDDAIEDREKAAEKAEKDLKKAEEKEKKSSDKDK